MEYFDNIGNKIEIGDDVLILVPKSDATYRRGVVKAFKDPWQRGDYFHCEVMVEYLCERLYSNVPHWEQRNGKPITFTKKVTKAWRSNSDIVKLKPEYIQ